MRSIGGCLFRYRNALRPRGDITRRIWPPPHHQFDPGRITFSAPNRAYSRLWLVAAFDESPYSLPVVTARFFQRSDAGDRARRHAFPIDAAVEAPALGADSASGGAVRLPLAGSDGSSLWLIPIELDAARMASEQWELPYLAIELTKAVHPWRAYPDPANYGLYQGGLPSGVRVFAMTLEKAPVHMVASGNRHGNTYVSPENPLWQIDLNNQLSEPVSGRVHLTVTDPYGEPTGDLSSGFSLPAAGSARVEIPISPLCYGLHTVRTEIALDVPGGGSANSFARTGTFMQLPPDTRQATAEDSQWGFLWWRGGHGTHDVVEDSLYLLRAAGARRSRREVGTETAEQWGFYPGVQHFGLARRAEAWAYKDPYDPEAYAATAERSGKRVAERHEINPFVPAWAMYTEQSITFDLTHGVPRRFIGEDPAWTEEEARRVRGHMVYAQAACEGIREHAPEALIALSWGGSGFTVPLLESGFPKELFDYIGVDEPVFERTPEMPIREVTPNRVWLLDQAMKEHGYDDILTTHTESYFPTSGPLGLGWRRSADHYVRLPILSLAMRPEITFWATFSLHDCSSYWGAQHYGEVGVISRMPEANPKPAFAAYATMSRLLDPGQYQGYIPTGSLSAYCLHFICREDNIYPMWTVRGAREARIRLEEGADAVMVDESGNEFPLDKDEDGWISVRLTPTPFWVISKGLIKEVVLGEPDHTFVRSEHPLMDTMFGDGTGRRRYRPENQVEPGGHNVLLDAFETPWNHLPGPYEPHAKGHLGAPRYDGPMSSGIVQCGEKNTAVWEIRLQEPDVQRELAAWYAVFEPDAPIEIPGSARALGVWADGRSSWGRIVYEIEDAGGEVWRSIGSRNEWNCDDIHTWSYFNYDGWRYIEFPLPGHLPYDNYRAKDTVWWGSDGGNNVVELPVKLKKIIIEQRTHHIYAEDLLEVEDPSVRLSRLKAVYNDAESMTDAPVELQRATAGLLDKKWEGRTPLLPNPIADLSETGVGEPTAFVSLSPPDEYDGLVTQLDIELRPVEGAREYRIYVAAYEDGSGAVRIARGEEPALTVRRLQPGLELYLFAAYTDAEGRESKPTPAHRILLIDDFPFR